MTNKDLLYIIEQAAKDKLKELNLAFNQLTNLPPRISLLSNLTQLYLSGNQLSSLPAEIGQLTNLERLDLGSNQLTNLPSEIGQLSNLGELNLSGNQLTNLLPEIGHLSKLTGLYLRDNQLINLPPEIGHLSMLEVLYLGSNQLTNLPPEIGHLSKLTMLYLGSNQLTSLPPEIGHLSKLAVLHFSDNRLTNLPPEIGQLTNLRQLQFSNNQLTNLPPEIGQLPNLAGFQVSGNQLTNLPPEIGQLTSLAVLHFSENQLTSLPPEIGHLSKVTVIYLDGNQLTSLPSEIGQLTGLERFNLNENKLTSLPPEIGQLSELKELNLNENKLTSLPPNIGQLSNLTILNLRNNQLTNLPLEIGQLSKLEYLDLRYNLLTIPLEILEKTGDIPAVINYYLDHQAAVKRKPLNEAKMLLVGQKGVGKTSLIKRLIEDKFDFDEPKTEGIDIRRWDVSVNNQKFRLNIWDFGGQEIMHATHQFFLTKRSLYLLILNARQDERDNRIEYWLKLIKSFGGDSPIIIVVNKCDLEMPDVSHKRLQDKYPAIKAIVNTSCKTRQGLQELSELIIEEVGQLKHIYEELPINWFAVKSHLEEIRADYISYQQYKELCQSHGISDERNQATLINFLHDLGVVLNFREDLRLQDTNILNPKWVTNGVYYILNNNLLFQAKGVLDQEMLAQILDHPEYPLDKQLFIMNMMRKFELCFDFEFQDKRFLIPDLLPQEELYTGDWAPTDCLGFQYHYDILPGNIMSRFIVRSNQLIHQNTYWRNGVLLSRNQNKALVKADREDCKTYIQINGPAGTRREFLAIIRAEFDHIHRTISKLEVKEKVPLTDHPNIVVDYQHLITLEQIGETSFIPEGMNERVTIKQLLDGIIPERKRQKQQKGHIAQEKVEPPQKVPVPISSSKAEVVKELTKIKNRLDLNAEKYTRRLLWLYFGLLAITWIGLGILTYQFGWNNMEPWTYFIGGIPTLGSYIYFAIIQRELSPQAIYNQIIETKKRKLLLAAELNGQKWPE